ncbi:CPBP family intramembrane glutamic endopeptidase [Caloramator australicus]|uniref:CPBP family intramembrane glutamic endopeptidase n=1 Tax=Caloramator australicus TaxID=515264 RepID=UPI00058D6C63|nr:CPBP family intramembrane glutamic endopeptidase [Caloramator australicus]
MKKILKLIGLLIMFGLVYFALNFGYVFIIAFIRGIIYVIQNPDKINDDSMIIVMEKFFSQYGLISMVVAEIVALGIYYFIYKSRNLDLVKVCNFSRVSFIKVILYILLGSSFSILIRFLVGILSMSDLFRNAVNDYNKITEYAIGNNIALIIIAVLLIGPIFEEIMFRGMIFNELKNNINIYLALALQSVIFGVYHMNLIQGLYAALLGLVLGILYYWERTIWVPIIIHISFNVAGVINNELLFSPLAILVSVITVVFVIAYLNKNKAFSRSSML